MRILYILPSLSKCSGVTTFAMNYFEKFSVNTKIDFLIINNKVDEYYRKIIEERKSKIYVLEKPLITNVISGVNKIKKFIYEHSSDYDIIHCHVAFFSAIYLKYAKDAGIKVRILHSHTSNSEEKNKIKILKNKILKKIALKNANYYFACSDLAGEYLFGKNKFYKVYNAIDLEKYKYDENIREKIRKYENIKENEFVIGHIRAILFTKKS